MNTETDGRPEPGSAPSAADPGLLCLCAIVRHLGMPASPDTLRRHHLPGDGVAHSEDLVRIARRLGLRARAVKTRWERFAKTPLPAIVPRANGQYDILIRMDREHAVVHSPLFGRERLLDREAFEAGWLGELILLARRFSPRAVADRLDLRWFLSVVQRYRVVLAEVLVASFFLQLLGLAVPLFFQIVVDKVLVHRGLSTLDVLVIGLGAVSLFEVLLGGLRTYVFSQTTNRIDVELGARLFDHLMGLPLAYFTSRRVGDSVARVRELENIRTFITGSALTLTIDLFFTFVFIAVMFLYSATLTWIVVASLPLYVLVSAVLTPLLRRRLDEKFARGADSQAFLVETVSGAETVKAMAIEPQMRQRWEDQLAGYVRASFRAQTLGNVGSQAVQFINKAVLVATLWFGAKEAMDGAMTVGELVAFNMMAGRVAQPVLRIAQLWQDFQQTRLSVARLGDILNTPRERARADAASLPPIKGEISFEHVTFRYGADSSAVLSDVSFSIRPGQVVGIVGPSGSGKSTLARLVQRLYVPDAGRVLIDGADLAMIDTSWLRHQIGTVSQDTVLFNRTVRENVALADSGAPIEQIVRATTLAGAHEFILELPLGYDTVIGERGASLSGGQRQRIAIARALMANPRILIFDEATSALDYESERIIQQNMRRIAAGRTVLLIAHRLSTVRAADRLLTLDRGRLVEEGTHEELVRRSGKYAQLYRLQAGIADAV